MKFKGTKGRWLMDLDKSHIHETKINTKEYRICEVKHYSSKIHKTLLECTIEEGKYNALLISKAPEMLEMLKGLLNESNDIVHSEIKKDIEKLIKEATEL